MSKFDSGGEFLYLVNDLLIFCRFLFDLSWQMWKQGARKDAWNYVTSINGTSRGGNLRNATDIIFLQSSWESWAWHENAPGSISSRWCGATAWCRGAACHKQSAASTPRSAVSYSSCHKRAGCDEEKRRVPSLSGKAQQRRHLASCFPCARCKRRKSGETSPRQNIHCQLEISRGLWGLCRCHIYN